MHKRVMALLLSLVLLLSAAMPVTAMAAEGYAGSFVLVAMNANRSTAFPPITYSIMTRVAISWTLRLLPSRPFASMYLRLIRTQLSS